MELDLRHLPGDINYDAATGNVAVAPATNSYSLHQALAAAGRGIPTGTCPPVGTAGHALGGGLGAQSRHAGLMCDALRSASVVLPGGQAVTASAASNPDLFWGCAGDAPFLDQDALPDRMLSVLDTYAMSPSFLTIEITEDLVVTHLAKARTVLNRLENGIRVAIDDFGSGYATLTYLRELPADEVKLGREFIAPILHDDRAATIARSLIELVSTFGIISVA